MIISHEERHKRCGINCQCRDCQEYKDYYDDSDRFARIDEENADDISATMGQSSEMPNVTGMGWLLLTPSEQQALR